MTRKQPLSVMVSDEAAFEVYEQGLHGIMLVMRPHGVAQGDVNEVGWYLTWAEADGLITLLGESIPAHLPNGS